MVNTSTNATHSNYFQMNGNEQKREVANRRRMRIDALNRSDWRLVLSCCCRSNPYGFWVCVQSWRQTVPAYCITIFMDVNRFSMLFFTQKKRSFQPHTICTHWNTFIITFRSFLLSTVHLSHSLFTIFRICQCFGSWAVTLFYIDWTFYFCWMWKSKLFNMGDIWANQTHCGGKKCERSFLTSIFGIIYYDFVVFGPFIADKYISINFYSSSLNFDRKFRLSLLFVFKEVFEPLMNDFGDQCNGICIPIVLTDQSSSTKLIKCN